MAVAPHAGGAAQRIVGGRHLGRARTRAARLAAAGARIGRAASPMRRPPASFRFACARRASGPGRAGTRRGPGSSCAATGSSATQCDAAAIIIAEFNPSSHTLYNHHRQYSIVNLRS
ncbi:hypothetical protein GSH08_00515 [Burkholderia pseudomallei]|nr:hypothetical protein [Burkholderia pseudomallei]MBM5584371.1 hypothetical protein [Burkholderia pseudomallei]MBM5666421.1 hypothetical protein [Burkholderia pseudomallei]MBM5690093.1 hypothetical protein [Burkholderia pseudomallei]RPA00033.1 hypothetical protein EGT86_24760 [Burkholderia pseudomallei]